MGIKAITHFFNKKLEDWQIMAMIYKVSEPLQGKVKP